MESNPRLAIILSHPTQYYSPWFRWLRANTNLTFRVFYLWDFGVTRQRDRQFQTAFQWDTDLLSGYDSEFVPNTAADPGTHHFSGLRNPDLNSRLAAWKPDALLLFGYKWSAHLRAIVWGWRNRIPLLFRGDSHLLGRKSQPWAQRVMLRTLYGRFSGFLCVGEANASYFRSLGVAATKLFRSPHSVDDSLFAFESDVHRRAASALRVELGLEDTTRVILFAGKLVPAKQPKELLQAFLAAAKPRTALIFVGDGPEKQELQRLASAAANVKFLPFANQSEMPARYLLADVFALPSRGHYETWGLAVNEAMHMGVPCLVSDLVGCQLDLVTDGNTGWVFSPTSADALRAKLAQAIDEVGNAARRNELQACVRERITGYTYRATTEGLLMALRSTVPAREAAR